MIRLALVRELRLGGADGGRGHVAAASGLVVRDGRAIVVADDSLSLASFDLESRAPGELRRLFPGELPADPAERKRRKPDLEALFEFGTERGLVALPSGSRPNRVRGAWVAEGAPRPIDFSPLFARLSAEIPGLNLEGATELSGGVALFHRGNTAGSENAVIRLDAAAFAADLRRGAITDRGLRGIRPVSLGAIDGVRLGFTGAARDARGRVWFLAAAEATDDAYLDGAYAGAVLGRLDEGLERVVESRRLVLAAKPEGLAFDPEGDGRAFYAVTDADDPAAVSGLFRGILD